MSKLFITKNAKEIGDLAKSREDHSFQLDKPRGNCPECGNQYRTPKDTKAFWYWLGYLAGQTSIIVAQRRKKKKWRNKK